MKKLLIPVLLFVLSACSLPGKSLFKHHVASISVPGYKAKISILDLKDAPPQYYISDGPEQVPDKVSIELKDMAYTPNNKFLQAGDLIEITLLDIGEDGLLSSNNTKELTLGRMTIGQNGIIALPFINRLSVTNLTPESLQNKIKNSLKGHTLNPQVRVSVLSKISNTVNVYGAIQKPGQYKLEPGREHLLDVVALAGGMIETSGQLTLIRNGIRASASFSSIIEDAEKNILLQSNDRLIFADAESNKFTALGAFIKPGEFKFETGKLSLGQAVERAGGTRSDDGTIKDLYLFRTEAKELRAGKAMGVAGIVGYHIELSDISNNLSIQRFYMRNGDKLLATKEPISG